VTCPDDLFQWDWRALRNEAVPWDSEDGNDGFDGVSRFWCPKAVFDIYWVVERDAGGHMSAHLTDDLVLRPLEVELPFKADDACLRRLADALGWQASVSSVLNDLCGYQLELFEDK